IINQEEIRQVTARDEKWVPTKERVKIGTINVRLDTTVPQKEETFQVIIDVIKNSTCYKAFTISAEVPKIFMQQFWYTVKKILDICPRVLREDFTKVPDDESTRTFLVDLGYKDFAFQIDNRQLKKGRREIMPYPRIGEDFQEYGLPILETMLTEGIKQSESYHMFIKYSTGLIAHKKIRAAKEEVARQVHATHERIVTESDLKLARRRPSEELAADTMQALKESKKISRRQPNIRGSSEGTGSIPGVPNESTVVFSPSSEGTITKPGVPEEEKVTYEAKIVVTLDWGSEDEREYTEENDDDKNIEWVDIDEEEEKNDDDNDKHIDLEKNDDEETDDEFVHSEEYVHDDDEETDGETIHDAEKTEEAKDDIKKAELPPTSSSLSVSLGFGNQFLNLSSDTSLIGIVKDTTNAEINYLLDPSVLTPIPETPSVATATTFLPPPSVSSISDVLLQTTTPIPTPPTTTEAPPVTTIPDLLHAIIQRVYVLEKDVQELKESGRCTSKGALETYRRTDTKVSQQVDYKEMIEESMQANIINEVKNQLPKFLPKEVSNFATSVIQSTVKKALEKTLLPLAQSSSQAQFSLKAIESLSKYELMMILFEKMDKSHSYLTHDKHRVLFDALLNSMILDDAIARGQSDPEKVLRKKIVMTKTLQLDQTRVRRPREVEPKSLSHQRNHLLPKNHLKDKDPKKDWFKQPPRPPTPDQEWNKHQVVDDQPEQHWFNNMVSVAKDPLTFDELMATPIDFSIIEREYNMEEYFKALIDKLDWNNPEGDRCPFDLTKPLLLKGLPGHLTVAAEYFFNNDLEFLKLSDPKKRHTTSITKTKAAQYEIVGVEYMVPILWSPTKVGYNKDAKKGIKH
ncbi:hypothetical protein Tco_0688706, partial [Tanacetum coccineum]